MKRIIKSTIFLFLFVFLIGGVLANNSGAALLNLKISYPLIFSDTSGTYDYTYDSKTALGLFTSTADPDHIDFGDEKIDFSDSDSDGYQVSFYVDSSGDFVDGVSGTDLTITGDITIDSTFYSGTALTGEVERFGWNDDFSKFEFTFFITGGYLDGLIFDSDQGGNIATVQYFEGDTAFSDWTTDHDGVAEHRTFVPIPATVWIFGAGLVGLMGIRRKLRV